MKIFFLLSILLLITKCLYSKEYKLDASAEIIINEEIQISDNVKESINKVKGTYTDSLGNYGEMITIGTIKSDNEKVILDFQYLSRYD